MDDLHSLEAVSVYKMWEPLRLTTYGPPRPVTGINLLFFFKQIFQCILLTQCGVVGSAETSVSISQTTRRDIHNIEK
jgi:hypothetical protein